MNIHFAADLVFRLELVATTFFDDIEVTRFATPTLLSPRIHSGVLSKLCFAILIWWATLTVCVDFFAMVIPSDEARF